MDCSELDKLISQLAMNIATDPKVESLADIVEQMKKLLPDMPITYEYVASAIESTIERKKKESDDISDKLNQIKREAKSSVTLREKISELEGYLETGTLPKVKKGQEPTDEIQQLRDIVQEIRKEIGRSAPAVQKRLEKSISDLEKKIQTGDIFPKQKPSPVTNKEIDRLIYERDMLRKEIQDEIRALKPLDFWGRAGVGIDFVRLWMTTGEFSFALRQGGIYAFTHPLKWSAALIESFKAFASPKALYNLNKKIQESENAPKYLSSGLILLHEGMSLTKSEEVIMNYWMDKLPVVRNFNRAAIAFMNKARADMFDAGYKTLSQNGEMTQDEMEVWANYINTMTGRGNLGKGRLSLEPAALLLNRFFFSPRYVASRFQIIGGAIQAPVMSIAGKNKMVYRQIAREYIRLATGVATVLGLGILCGADIEDDPRSTDFGKLIFGRKRLDPLMGFGQTLTFLSRILTGTTKSGGGTVYPIRPQNVFFYKDKFFTQEADVSFGGKDIEDVFGRFLRSKMSPQMGMAWNIITGKNFLGEDVTVLNSLSQIAYPMTYGDIYDVMKEDNIPANTALSLLTILGMGLQTYEGDKKEYRVF